jgi:hypothetical protein
MELQFYAFLSSAPDEDGWPVSPGQLTTGRKAPIFRL